MRIETGTSLTAKNVLILGLGNILLKDEGVGVHAVKRLQEMHLPENADLIDGGTAGLDVLLSAGDVDKLVVIDALKAGNEAGTIYKARFKANEKKKLTEFFEQEKGSKISLHQVNLLDALTAAEKLNLVFDEIVIIGVEPGEIDCGLQLTRQVERSMPDIIKTVLEEIQDDIHREQTDK